MWVYNLAITGMTMKVPAPLKTWLYLALVSTALVGLVYVAQQHQYRMDANDPQIQLAEDGAQALKAGTAPGDIAGNRTVDLRSSLAPFRMVFDQDRNVLAYGGDFGGQRVQPPDGTFDTAKQRGEYRFTWEPRPGVRQAAVLTYAQGAGYVLASRSLYEVEIREYDLLVMCAFALAVVLAAAGAMVAILK
jgi:hypothetical protein